MKAIFFLLYENKFIPATQYTFLVISFFLTWTYDIIGFFHMFFFLNTRGFTRCFTHFLLHLFLFLKKSVNLVFKKVALYIVG